MQNLFFLVLIGFLVWIFVTGNSPSVEDNSSQFSPDPVADIPKSPFATQATSTSIYQCDGRQYCSEMISRNEAIFFINNCPNTKMDSDNDGVPCENDSRFEKY